MKTFYRSLYKRCNYNDYIHIYDEPIILWTEGRPFGSPISQQVRDKPSGLWISYPNIDDSWTGFCLRVRELNERIDPKFNTIYRVSIKEEQILFIDTIKQLEEFHNKYTVMVSTFLLNHKVRWKLLVHQWSGIFIQYMYPFLESCKNPVHQAILSWYGSWDCASGCIWNGRAIHNVETLYRRRETTLHKKI
jgi:hypothetical protein